MRGHERRGFDDFRATTGAERGVIAFVKCEVGHDRAALVVKFLADIPVILRGDGKEIFEQLIHRYHGGRDLERDFLVGFFHGFISPGWIWVCGWKRGR